jgi:hypothetical protein
MKDVQSIDNGKNVTANESLHQCIERLTNEKDLIFGYCNDITQYDCNKLKAENNFLKKEIEEKRKNEEALKKDLIKSEKDKTIILEIMARHNNEQKLKPYNDYNFPTNNIQTIQSSIDLTNNQKKKVIRMIEENDLNQNTKSDKGIKFIK